MLRKSSNWRSSIGPSRPAAATDWTCGLVTMPETSAKVVTATRPLIVHLVQGGWKQDAPEVRPASEFGAPHPCPNKPRPLHLNGVARAANRALKETPEIYGAAAAKGAKVVSAAVSAAAGVRGRQVRNAAGEFIGEL